LELESKLSLILNHICGKCRELHSTECKKLANLMSSPWLRDINKNIPDEDALDFLIVQQCSHYLDLFWQEPQS